MTARMTARMPAPILPVGRAALHARIADLAAGHAARVGAAGAALRVGVDGPVTADTRDLADGVVAAIAGTGRPVVAVHAEDFLRARSLRLEYGEDADAYYERWYDLGTLRREVLDPLGPGGALRYLPRLRDPDADRPYRDRPVPVPPGTVLVLDGRFLADPDLAGALDVLVLLDVSAAAARRRLPERERDTVGPAWERYLAELDPADSADLVIRFDHPDRPAVVRG